MIVILTTAITLMVTLTHYRMHYRVHVHFEGRQFIISSCTDQTLFFFAGKLSDCSAYILCPSVRSVLLSIPLLAPSAGLNGGRFIDDGEDILIGPESPACNHVLASVHS